LFDGATMIRTLHHMADPSLALSQVRCVLSSGAVFILEYANKHNLKAILRYWLKRQSWSPFTHEAVEFARLNYDFHPEAIRNWLLENRFIIERQLTVSHFRAGFLKQVIPTGLLAWLDGVFQPSGALFQLTPSIFLRARARGDPTPITKGLFFKCLNCGNGMPEFSGDMRCPECGQHWKQKDGIYDFRLDK
jgi:hypothetical protein